MKRVRADTRGRLAVRVVELDPAAHQRARAREYLHEIALGRSGPLRDRGRHPEDAPVLSVVILVRRLQRQMEAGVPQVFATAVCRRVVYRAVAVQNDAVADIGNVRRDVA